MRCSEPGESVAVAIIASRAPGLPPLRDWVVRRLHTIMENIEHKQTATEAAGAIAGFSGGAFRAACRGKHISAAIIVLAGAVLLLGGSFIRHADTKLFVQVVGCLVGAVGLVGWIFSSTKS
jgi:hypothetical protein